MAEKKRPFSESDLTNKGYIEVSRGMFIKATSPLLVKDDEPSPVSKLAAKIKSESEGAAPIKRNGKYGVATISDRTYNGKTYDSKLEMQYRQHLDLLFKAGEVIYIEEQVPYDLVVLNKKVCIYILDFRITYKDGSKKYIDVKGMATSVYRIKKKLFEAIMNPITITEIKKGDF